MARPPLAPALPAGHDVYLADLARRLRGPRRSREAILTEVQDGLLEATERRTAAGVPPERAAAEARAEFGPSPRLAQGFDAELNVASARWTVLAFLGTGPLIGVWWLLLLYRGGGPFDPWAAYRAIPVLPLVAVAVIACCVVVAITGKLTRWLQSATARPALSGAAAVAILAVVIDFTMLSRLALTLLSGQRVTSVVFAAIAVTASLARLVAGSRIGWRCLRARTTS